VLDAKLGKTASKIIKKLYVYVYVCVYGKKMKEKKKSHIRV
jgi:hypothetical protein